MPKRLSRLQKAAKKLIDHDLWVVPCDDKKPIWKEWQTKQRTEEELMAALDQPGRNIAVVLNQSQWIDVECDSDEAALQKLFGGKVPPTPTWKSRRGKHRLFNRPDGLSKKAVIEIDGIEFKVGNGKGTASVFPPSVDSETGQPRKWIRGKTLDDIEPAELPAEIVERLRTSATQTASEPSGSEDIPEGKRNKTLFGKGIAAKATGLDEAAIAALLLDQNARLCKPPLDEAEVQAIAHSVAKCDEDTKVGFLSRLLKDIELWHDENDEPFITLPQGEHRENWKISKKSRSFRRWLSKMFYDATGEMLGASDLSDIASMLEGKAVFDSPRYPVFCRTARHEGKFYLDLCEKDWRVVEVDPDGWQVVSNPPVKFRRANAMHPLPIPIQTDGRELQTLLCPFLNIREAQWPLVAAWLVAALRPVGPYPILKLLGEQGSAKTTTARILRAVVDPNAAPVRAEPRSTRDLVIAANNAWVLCLDNLSKIKPDLSDALCRLSTGGGFATRTLYTDDDETIFDAQRPMILTSIEDIGTRSDLLERSLIIELPPIHEAGRRAEKTFWAEFEEVRPLVLGAMLDVVSGAIQRLPEIEQKTDVELPRLADFHMWGQAAEVPLGLDPGTFAEAFTANQEATTRIVLESSPLIQFLLKRLKHVREVEDTAQGLLDTCNNLATGLQQQPGWPKTPRVLSAILRRSAPNLRQIGITAVQDTRGGGNAKEKIWRICDPSAPEPKRIEIGNATTKKTTTKEGRNDRKGRKNTKSISKKKETRRG